MKRCFTLFLGLLLLTVSIGFTASAHFCNGVKQEMQFFPTEHQDKVCPICATKNKQKEKKENCCKHEAAQLKLSAKIQKNPQEQNIFKFSAEVLFLRSAALPDDQYAVIAEQYAPALSILTPIQTSPLYLLHCVYRI